MVLKQRATFPLIVLLIDITFNKISDAYTYFYIVNQFWNRNQVLQLYWEN